MKLQLRKLDWSQLVMHFIDLKEKKSTSPLEIVDYFHFRYISLAGMNLWVSPDYIRQTPCAKKLLSLYGDKLTIELIDIMFDNYDELLHKKFSDIRWSLGMLSSEKMGWFMEKVFAIYEYNKSTDKKDVLKRLLAKDRKDWTAQELEEFNKLIVLQ